MPGLLQPFRPWEQVGFSRLCRARPPGKSSRPWPIRPRRSSSLCCRRSSSWRSRQSPLMVARSSLNASSASRPRLPFRLLESSMPVCQLWILCAFLLGSSLPQWETWSTSRPLQLALLPQVLSCLVLKRRSRTRTQVSRPVSSSALGLLVPGPQDVDGATLPGVRLRFTAKLLATGEPVLLSASLFQLGCVEACKYQPQQVATVEITPSVVAKFTLFRDEALIDWQEVVRAPVKALLDGVPQLRTCRQVGCGCIQWHSTSGAGEPQALLEIWGRAFQKHTAKPELPAAAAQFVVFLRLPASLLPTVLAASELAGIYCDARARAAPDFS